MSHQFEIILQFFLLQFDCHCLRVEFIAEQFEQRMINNARASTTLYHELWSCIVVMMNKDFALHEFHDSRISHQFINYTQSMISRKCCLAAINQKHEWLLVLPKLSEKHFAFIPHWLCQCSSVLDKLEEKQKNDEEKLEIKTETMEGLIL